MSLLLLFRGASVVPPPTGDVGKSASFTVSFGGANAGGVLSFVGQTASNLGTEQDFAIDPAGDLFTINPSGDVFLVGPGGALTFIGKTSAQGV